MGVLANTKQFIANKTRALAHKAANELASASALSPSQLETVDARRKEYLSQKPDMNSDAVRDIISNNLGAVGIEVYQAYLRQLKNVYKPINTAIGSFDEINRVRYFDITKWVTDPEEKNLDKLVNVYQVLSEEDCNIALIYTRKVNECIVTLGVVNTDEKQSDPSKAKTYIERLESALVGNFPGVELKCNSGKRDPFGIGIPHALNGVVQKKKQNVEASSVAIVSNMASEKSEDFISQSMEKLLDGIAPKDESEEYTIVLLAKPVVNQLEMKNRLYELYSALVPYATWQTNYTYTTSDAVNSSANFGVNLGVSAGIQQSVAIANGVHTSRIDESKAPLDGSNKTNSIKKGLGNVITQMVGMYAPIQDTNTTTTINGYQANANFGVSFSRSSSVTAQIGINEGITQNYSNYAVSHTLEVIEKQVKRVEESSALGMWEFASYVISESPVVANNVAHMYLALTQGEESHMTSASVSLWDGRENADDAQTILANVQKLQHPVFGLKSSVDKSWLMYPTLVTPSTVLSGKELAKSLNFPRKSINGLPVLETVSFGREVHRFDIEDMERKINVGKIYHMRKSEETPVFLNTNSLTSHVFISGSTGTGKSNAIYQMVDKLQNEKVKWLVVEPAKGEYKQVFGGKVKVYGTNEYKSELLKINPFSFPKGIHVLEHIDRLVEIFNACWPMYAAMPAILKDAIEKSYIKHGWNLRNSLCEPLEFPTFADLIETLPEVMNSSVYSADTRSDYEGALSTRVQSLTNGINGQIFCSSKELSDEDLFENNVIVDLSRVGSNETKSLMMGIIVMKLQEYRLQLEKMNNDLIHVTILEEAHNLLRRTSVAQLQEGSNLQGKAVEMLTNAIAEMRTYGEGFIIADQAPGLLDESVIRNTNTKIVLRLPDEQDREIVGSAMALTDAQKTELAKLPKGVAAVYQNDWVEAVLCQFEEYKKDKYVPLRYTYKDNHIVISEFLNVVFGVKDNREIKNEDVDTISDWISSMKASSKTKSILYAVLNGAKATKDEMKIVAYNVFEGKKMAIVLADNKEKEEGIDRVNKRIQSEIGVNDAILIDHIRQNIFAVIFANNNGELAQRYRIEEGRVK